MVRRSSQSKSSPSLVVAVYSATGMCTRPKLMAPFQTTRAVGRDVLLSSEAESSAMALPEGCFKQLKVDEGAWL